MVMITVRVIIVAEVADVGVVTFEEWASKNFSFYICWLNDVFKIGRING